MPTAAVSRAERLLTTKLHVPTPTGGLVPRRRLVHRLDEGAPRLTLVVGPAGFGKTTLVAEWLADWSDSVGWVSLDAGDNDPSLFWGYVLAALQQAGVDVGDKVPAMLFAPEPIPPATVLTALINEIARFDGSLALVLDDFHVVDDPGIHEGVAFLLEHMPPSLRLIVISRRELPFPVARLRSQGDLLELTPTELRFTPGEIQTFLEDVMGLILSPEAVSGLERRTEGWIAGLQLAALSMRSRDDPEAFAHAFSGDHRHVADLLVEEVLQREKPEIRSFLLRTSVLERMSAPLCEAVTGVPDGRAMLEELERRRLFVVGLDDRREWFRFHHLFADVLRNRLARVAPDLIPGLHASASRWLEARGLLPEAVHHARSSADVHLLADLVERSWRAMDRDFQAAKWLKWVEPLPSDVIWARPVLTMGVGWALLDTGRIEEAVPYLDRTVWWLGPDADADARVGRRRGGVPLPTWHAGGSPGVSRPGHGRPAGDRAVRPSGPGPPPRRRPRSTGVSRRSSSGWVIGVAAS